MMRKKRQLTTIPLHDPAMIEVLAIEESTHYRVRLLKGINYGRLFFAACLLMYFLLSEPKLYGGIFIGQKVSSHDYSLYFWWLFSIYILLLIFCNILLQYPSNQRWIFWVIALLEVLVLSPLLSLVFGGSPSNINIILVLCSLLLSVLTLSALEGAILGPLLGMLFLFYFLIKLIATQSYISVLKTQTQLERLTSIFHSIDFSQNSLLDPIIYSLSLALMIVVMAKLASQARDNKILSELNYFYNKQLRKLNDSIIEDIQSGLIVANVRGVIITLNLQARKIFALADKEKPPHLLTQLSPDLAKRFGRWVNVQFSDKRTIKVDSNEYSVNFNTLQQRDNMDLILITLESIEESMQRVRETRLASLGRLTAGIAHEIRNPLASVQSAADILLESNNGQQVNFLTEKIINNTKRINIIISDILNMFQESSCRTKLIDFNSSIERIVTQAQQDSLTKQAKIIMELSKTKGYSVYFDPGHLSQILNNFIMNSIAHSGVDEVEVEIKSQISKIGRQIYLDISDNGKGVTLEDREMIFEPFFSRRNSTGLGLYLVREMCVANQAQIVYIQKDKGACFRISMERFLTTDPEMIEIKEG